MGDNGGVRLGAGLSGQAIGSLRSFRHRPARVRPVLGVAGVDPHEASEIDAMLNAVSADVSDLALRLTWRLNPLVQRSVPARAIEAAPVPQAARLRFADGTAVVVRSAVPGDVGVLALAMRRGSVRPAACATGPDGATRLVFTWPGGRHGLSLRVLGLDQPD